jgi:hypothetical protein
MSTSCIKKLETKKIISLRRPHSPNSIKEKTLDILTQKEQQEQSEGKEGIEIHGEAQAETKKNQRGSYRQYEDTNVILEKIRYYRIQRHPDSEIMNLLDNMPRRTYYNYVKKMQEQERQITEQWMSEHVEHYAEELMIYRETLCQKLREIQGIIDNKIHRQEKRCKQ